MTLEMRAECERCGLDLAAGDPRGSACTNALLHRMRGGAAARVSELRR
jgi:hypothetical protein